MGSTFKNHTTRRMAKRMRALLKQGAVAISRLLPKEQVVAPGRELVRTRLRSAESSPMFFVVGNQKSGTTWLMTMLDSHPEILCWGEGRPFGRHWRQEHLKQNPVSYPPTSLYNAFLSSEDLRYWIERSVWTRREDTDVHLANLTGLAIEYFLTGQLLKSGKRFVGDKTVLSEGGIMEEVATICPGAKVIHIIRDGRDVAVSQMHHRWNQAEDRGGTVRLTPDQLRKREVYREDPRTLLKTDDGIFPEGQLEKYAARWNLRVGKATIDGPGLLGANYTEVKYEDLLERPEEEIRRLLGFLGADASESTVRQCVDAARFEKLAGGRERGQEAASFFRKGIAGDWKNVFTEQNKQDFKANAGDLLVKLGYEQDNAW